MNEAELVSELGFRSGMTWDLLQWWVSIGFAVMVASYIGAAKLTKGITALIIFMFAITTAGALSAMLNHASYMQDIYRSLEVLASESELSYVGIGALERQGGYAVIISGVFFVLSIIFIFGFVIYCYKYLKDAK